MPTTKSPAPEPVSPVAGEPDWKAVATALAQRLTFALHHLHPHGSGLLLRESAGALLPWHEYMAEGLALVPGLESLPAPLPRAAQRCSNNAKSHATRSAPTAELPTMRRGSERTDRQLAKR